MIIYAKGVKMENAKNMAHHQDNPIRLPTRLPMEEWDKIEIDNEKGTK